MLPAPPGASETHDGHTPHGVGVGPCSQFSDRARIRALEVLPQPRGPENRYAWLIRPAVNAWISGAVTCSCPITSEKSAERYFRYSANATGPPYRQPSGAGSVPSTESDGVRRLRFVPRLRGIWCGLADRPAGHP